MKSIIRIPVIGYLVRLFTFIIKLPLKFDELYRYEKSTSKNINTIYQKLEEMNESVSQLTANNSDTHNRIISINNRINSAYASMPAKSSNTLTQDISNNYFANNHLLDNFYLEFENKFRGSESDIIERLKEYLPEFNTIKKLSHKKPVLDIGCGRGELLQFLKDNKIKALGIDINGAMVKACKKKKLNAIEGDAVKYLNEVEEGSLGAITGFHIVEHIEFPDLLSVFSATYRAISNDGFVLFETPNPENLYVGSNTFHYDPSHLKPIPPQLLKFTLESVGYSNVTIKYLHPERENTDNMEIEMHNRLFGPRDYAVIARK